MLTTLLLSVALGQTPVQNVRPQIGYVYPPGARAGTTIDVRLGTYDWTPDMQIIVHDPRVKIEITGPAGDPILTPPPYWFGQKAGQAQPPLAREVPARITLPADLAPGPIRWQAANANGGSNVGKFIVTDTAEFIEPDKRDGPLEMPDLPVTVSGRLSRITEVDAYTFRVAAPGLVVCRLDDRLGQPFHGLLSIRDSQGRLIADSADTTGSGAEVLFTAQKETVYSATIHDLEFGGDAGYVYRLSVRRGPKVAATLPLVIGRGQTQAVEFIGWGVATGENKLESVKRDVSIPADASGDSFVYSLETPAGAAWATLSLGGSSDSPPTAALSVPAALSTAIERLDPMLGLPGDRYRFTGKKGETTRFEAQSDRFSSPVDPSLIVLSAEGKELARNDDAAGTTDAALEFKATADGDYELAVVDLSGLPPSRASVYRLTAESATAAQDFSLTIPDRFDVPLGAAADLTLRAVRQGTWKEPISLRFEGLPDGVAISGAAEIPQAKNDLKLSLAASDKAAARASLATLIASATIGEQTIEHRLGPILVTAMIKTRCQVKSAVQDGGRLVNRGTTYPADVVIQRLEGYEGPITLQMAATQQRQRRGIRAQSVLVPAGQTQAQFPIHMPEWLETSLTARMNVVGVIEIPDPQGNLRHVMGNMDGLIVMSLEGALLKLSHEPQERTVRPGETIEIPIRLSRSAQLAGEARIELSPAQDLVTAGFITSEPIVLAPHQSTGTVRIKIADQARLSGMRDVVIRATILQHGRWPAISETFVPLLVDERR